MSTAAALIAVCIALLGLVLVVTVTFAAPGGGRRPATPISSLFDGGQTLELHEISTRQEYPKWVSSNLRRKEQPMETLLYTVPGMHCEHCKVSVETEVTAVPGVSEVTVDLKSKRVEVRGEPLDDAAIRVAIEEAGYEAA